MSAEAPDSVVPRLAIVGANSLLGKEIKEQLARSGYPGARTSLFELEELAGLLTDYGTEARVINETVAEQVLDHEIVCFCGDRGTARGYLEQVLASGCLGLDSTAAWLADDRAFVWIPGLNAPPSISEHRALVIPPAASLLLGSTLAALGDVGSGSSANVFVPASERGDEGLNELAQQSSAVLGLMEIDSDVFGRQMAFDMWLHPAEDALGAEQLAATLRRLGLTVPAINVAAVPVFHGMALSLFLRGAEADDVTSGLRDAGISVHDGTGAVDRAGAVDRTDEVDQAAAVEDAGAVVDSPVRGAGIAGIHASRVRDDVDGAWVWAVADNLHTRAAAAVAGIHALAGVAVSDAPQ